MKKLDPSISVDYLPLRLNLDDVQAIETVLRESAKSISFEAEGFEFDSLDELTAKFRSRTLRNLKISSSSPHTQIDLSSHWGRLYVGSSEITSIGVFHKLDEVLKHAGIRMQLLYNYNITWVFIVMYPLLGALTHEPIVTISAYLLGLAWILWIGYVRVSRHSMVSMISKSQSGTFFSRKKDDLILALISGLIGALLGIAGTLLSTYLTK
jgi:hypothetical protein